MIKLLNKVRDDIVAKMKIKNDLPLIIMLQGIIISEYYCWMIYDEFHIGLYTVPVVIYLLGIFISKVRICRYNCIDFINILSYIAFFIGIAGYIKYTYSISYKMTSVEFYFLWINAFFFTSIIYWKEKKTLYSVNIIMILLSQIILLQMDGKYCVLLFELQICGILIALLGKRLNKYAISSAIILIYILFSVVSLKLGHFLRINIFHLLGRIINDNDKLVTQINGWKYLFANNTSSLSLKEIGIESTNNLWLDLGCKYNFLIIIFAIIFSFFMILRVIRLGLNYSVSEYFPLILLFVIINIYSCFDANSINIENMMYFYLFVCGVIAGILHDTSIIGGKNL